MRIFYITAEPWPTFRADVAVLFGKYLPRLGIQADLVTGTTFSEVHQPWTGGEAILTNVSGGQAQKHLKTFFHIFRALLCLNPARYHAVQVRDLPLAAALAMLFAWRNGLPFYYWMSYPMPEGYMSLARERGLSAGLMKFLFPWIRGRLGRFLLYRVVLPNADHVFVQSERMKADMLARGFPEEKMTPVPMGVDLETIDAAPISPSDDPRLDRRSVMVYLGTLDRPRHIEVLFDMLALVRQQEPAAVLVLAGDTSDSLHLQWLKERALRAGVADYVIWTGWLPMREGWKYVRAAKVGLSPIPRGPLLDVGSPTKVVEYLALGIPVVCNDNPDQQAIINSSGAGRCVPYTAVDFAKAVLSILSLDAGARLRIAQQGRSYVAESRDYAEIAKGVAAVYGQIAQCRSYR